MSTKSQLLGKPLTTGYRPSVLGHLSSWSGSNRGRFGLHDIEEMRWDPRVRLGLRCIKAPISVVQWSVTSQDQAVQAWVDRQLKHIWRTELSQLLLMIDYGRSGGEAIWRLDRDTDFVEVDCLRHVYAYDIQPLEAGSKFWGIRVKSSSADLPIGRCFHLVNEPEISPYWGRSRLSGAWAPWMEKSGRHGAIDSRRLWYVKNAYRGGIMRHPEGMLDLGGGVLKSCQDYAREMAEKGETGQILVFPNSKNPETGDYLWIYEEPKINGDVSGIREYVKDVDREILEGLEVFPEVVEAVSTGSWAGRTVPFLVFLTSEDAIADNLVLSLDKTILRPGAEANFGRSVKYEIKIKSLVPKDEEQKPSSGGQGLGGLLGGQGGQGGEQGGGQAQGQPQQPQQMSLERLSDSSHKFSSTQFDLSEETAAQILALSSKIPEEDLGEDGRENRPHVTVLYGLHTDDPDKVRQLVEDFGSVPLTLRKMSLFPDNGKGYDVLKIDVESERLHKLHNLLSGLSHTQTHPEYKPHVTIAYLKPGDGKRYASIWQDELEGLRLTLSDLVFSSPDGNKTTISLEGDNWLSTTRLAQGISSWTRYEGPHGGHGWKHGETGEVVYQEEMPGEAKAGKTEVGKKAAVFTPQEEAALREYSGGAAFRINAALRDGTEPPGRLKATDEALQSAFAKAKPGEVRKVYRGLPISPAAADEFAKQAKESMGSGEPMVNLGYSSTTTKADDVAGTAISMAITTRHGIDMAGVSNSPDEGEVLLNRGGSFAIESVTKTADGWHIEAEHFDPNKASMSLDASGHEHKGKGPGGGQFGSGSGGGSRGGKLLLSGPALSAHLEKRQRERSRLASAARTALLKRTARAVANKAKALTKGVLAEMKPASILGRINDAVSAVRHPVETVKRVKDKAVERYKALEERYGRAGAIAIAGAYAGYYVAFTLNPLATMAVVPSPSAVLLGSAEALKFAAENAKNLPNLANMRLGQFVEAEHPRGQPENAGQFGPGGGRQKLKGGRAKPVSTKTKKPGETKPAETVAKEKMAKKPLAKDKEPEEEFIPVEDRDLDDATIEASGDRTHEATWMFYDDDGNEFEQEIVCVTGTAEFDDGEELEVYRWESRQYGSTTERGEWTADRDDAVSEGENYAEENNQEPPEPDDDDDDEDEDDEVPDELRSFLDKDNARRLCGAPSDAKVTAVWDDDELKIEITHPHIESCERTLGIDDQGLPFIHNDIFVVNKTAPPGFGSAQFAAQVAAAKAAGFAYIETHAAGSYGHKWFNGYYTWARLGYDMDVADLQNRATKAACADVFPDAVSVLDIIDVPEVDGLSDARADEIRDKCAAIDAKLKRPVRDRTTITGADWWQVHGSDMHHAVFMLSDGSRSMKKNADYNSEKKKK